MKKFIALLMSVIMVLTLSGCGGSTEEKSEVSLVEISGERTTMEKAGALVTRLYTIARLKTDALIEYDLENGSIEQLKMMTDDALEAWRLCEIASNKTIELMDYAQSLHSSMSGSKAILTYIPPSSPPFMKVVYAAEENAALKWAKDLTAKYDTYPSGQKIKQLSENLGTDAKNAFAQLKMAQAILEGAAYNDEADTIQKYENAATATKTICKTGLYIGGVIAGGGVANGILEAGGLVIGGVDTIVDIASTSSTIILGEDNMVTAAANDFKDIMAPVSSIAGGINVLSGGMIKAGQTVAEKAGNIDKLSYIGDSIVDLVNDGKILGGVITVGDDGESKITMTEISTEGKTPEEVAKEMKEAGLPVPSDNEPKSATELSEEMEEGYDFTEEELIEVIDNLMNLLNELFLEPDEAAPETPQEKPVSTGNLSIKDLEGDYDVTVSGDNIRTQETKLEFTIRDGELELDKGLYITLQKMPYDYDKGTGTAVINYTSPVDGHTTTDTFTFTKVNGSITIKGTSVSVGDEGTHTIYVEGVKVD